MGIRVVDTTLTPPATPPATLPATPPATPTSIIPGLFPQDEESLALAALRTEEYAWSSGWEADSDSEEGSLERISKKDEKKKQNLLRAYASEKNSNNIFSRGLRRARRCVGKAVMATGRRISPCGGGVGNCGGVGGLDGEGGDKKGRRGGRGGDEGAFGKVVKRIKRSALFWKSEPVRLRPAKVRMVLD